MITHRVFSNIHSSNQYKTKGKKKIPNNALLIHSLTDILSNTMHLLSSDRT